MGSIADLNRLPSAIFVVDILKEKIAVSEARKLNIPTFAIVDTNSDPTLMDFPIPANDDASKSIDIITKIMVKTVTARDVSINTGSWVAERTMRYSPWPAA